MNQQSLSFMERMEGFRDVIAMVTIRIRREGEIYYLSLVNIINIEINRLFMLNSPNLKIRTDIKGFLAYT
jgi:hypothetical protein